MLRLAFPTLAAAPTATRPLLDAVTVLPGSIPKPLSQPRAQGPAVVEGALVPSRATHRAFDLMRQKRIALAVAGVKGCDDGLSVRAALGMARPIRRRSRWPDTGPSAPETRGAELAAPLRALPDRHPA